LPRPARTGWFCDLQGQEVTDCHNQRRMTWTAARRSSLYALSPQRTDDPPRKSRKNISKWREPMNIINRRVSTLELRIASLRGNERRDEHGRTPAEAILEARRRRRAKEGLPPEESRPPTRFMARWRPQSIAEAIRAARAAAMARAGLIRP